MANFIMFILIGLLVSGLIGAVAFFGIFRWRQWHHGEPRRRLDDGLAERSELDALKRELAQLLPRLYRSDRRSQQAVGASLNLAMAYFRSRYSRAAVFAAVPQREQREFLNRLTEAELRFYEQNRQEEGAATTLFKCWLTAIAANDLAMAREVRSHVDHFCRLPRDETGAAHSSGYSAA